MKTIKGVVLGGVVLFFWGFVSWMFVPWHEKTMHKLPNEQLVMDVLKANETSRGLYIFPASKTDTGRMEEKEFTEKFIKGPTGLLIYSPGGVPPMGAKQFIVELIRCFILAWMALFLLCLAGDRIPSYIGKVLLVTAFELVAFFVVDLMYWNWMKFPLTYTLVNLIDGLIGFFLLGLVAAKFYCRCDDKEKI